MVVLRNLLIQSFQHDFRITDDMVVRLNVLVDFGPVDVDMNDFSVTGKRIRLQCHPVREAAADGNQQIAAVYSAVGCLGSVHANHSCRQRIRTVHGTSAHQGDGNRRIHLAGKFPEFFVGPASGYAAAANQHRFLGFLNHVYQDIDILLIRLRSQQTAGAGTANQFAQSTGSGMSLLGNRLIIHLCCSNVLRNIDEHRSRSAASGNAESLSHRIRQFVHIPYEVVGLGNRHGNTGDVHLLESILAQHFLSYVTADKNNRRRVHIRSGDSGGEVGCSRSGSGQTYPHLSGGSGIAVRRMRRSLLVCGKVVSNLILVFVEFIVNIQNCAAGIPEHGIHALLQQAFYHDLCTCHFHMNCSS